MRDGREPAFPFEWTEGAGAYEQRCSTPGMSLRDWFAGQSLPACLTLAINIELAGRELIDDAQIVAAKMAYRVADAMLKESEQ